MDLPGLIAESLLRTRSEAIIAADRNALFVSGTRARSAFSVMPPQMRLAAPSTSSFPSV